jgi:membrane-bound serine protease (ClpP class)
MFDSDIPGFGISYAFVIGIALVFAVLVVWLVGFLLKLRRRGAVSGTASIIGGIATAVEDFTGNGKVWLEGEAWQARSALPLTKNQQVVVRTMDGLILVVEPLTDAKESDDR